MMILFLLLKDTKLHVPVVALSARNNQKLIKLCSKGFERSVFRNNTRNEYRYFLKSNFVGGNRLFVLVCSNEDNDSKRFQAKRYYLPKDNQKL